MATCKCTTQDAASLNPPAGTADFGAILNKLAGSRAVIETACKVMELDEHGAEVITLRTGLDLLDRVYNELDCAISEQERGHCDA